MGAIPTRDRKQYGIETHTWREEMTARAAEHGLDSEQVEQIVGRGEERLQHGGSPATGRSSTPAAWWGRGSSARCSPGPTG